MFGNEKHKFSSAIYFTGANMNMDRVLNITLNGEGHMYAMAERRKQFVDHLHEYEHEIKMTKVDQTKIIEWTKTRMALPSIIQ